MTTRIKAIQTTYRGHKFRSRLEARWAIFFDAVGIEWEYEKEGWELQSGLYLPDFWLPQVYMWAEVKGAHFTGHELTLCAQLAGNTVRRVLLLDGMPNYHTYTAFGNSGFNHGQFDTDVFRFDLQHPNFDWRKERTFHSGFQDTIETGCEEYPVVYEAHGPYLFSMGCMRTASKGNEKAINAARSARFEHGEQG